MKFDWHSEKLSSETKLDKNYKSTQNVRRFFKKHLGDDFHFNVAFMAFLKAHAGTTLGGAITEWKKNQELYIKKSSGNKLTVSTKVKYDWHSEKLSLETKLDKNYKSTQNVRRFFKKHLGDDFHFNIQFMAFLKTHAGTTLGEAITEWKKNHKV